MEMLYGALLLLSWLGKGSGASFVTLAIDTLTPLHQTEPFYTSFNIDNLIFQMGWGSFNFSSPRLHTLLRGLSPAILRIGGTVADETIFDQPFSKLNASGAEPSFTVMSTTDWDNLVAVTLHTGNRLLYDLNLQLRYGSQLDPSMAIRLMDYSTSKGYGNNIDWELGNEPDLYIDHPTWVTLHPATIGSDFVSLRKVIQQYPNFRNSRLVGPDVGGVGDGSFSKEFINVAGGHIDAYTFHHYYFRGPTATWKDYIDPKHFYSLEATIMIALKAVKDSQYPDTAVWLGESADAYNRGTANVSTRFVSGFLWLDKLGLCAQYGVRAVLRQTFYRLNYALIDNNLNPNPDYWLTYVFHHLVGQKVLSTKVSSNSPSVRVYAHCTAERSGYAAGAITVFTLSVNQTDAEIISFGSEFHGQTLDVYLLAPGDKLGLLAKLTALNGTPLKLIDDMTLPQLKPLSHKISGGLRLPPLTMAFAVLPQAAAAACF